MFYCCHKRPQFFSPDLKPRESIMSRLIARKALLIQVICLMFITDVVHCNQETFGGGKFTLSWSYNASDERLYFKVVAETSGWVGLGFSDQNEGMKNLDCVVGGVSAGTGYLNVSIKM